MNRGALQQGVLVILGDLAVENHAIAHTQRAGIIDQFLLPPTASDYIQHHAVERRDDIHRMLNLLVRNQARQRHRMLAIAIQLRRVQRHGIHAIAHDMNPLLIHTQRNELLSARL